MEGRVKPLVVLDFDGVITRVALDWPAVREELSRRLGVRIDSFLGFFESRFGTLEYEAVSKALEEYELAALSRAEPYPDVRAALELAAPVVVATMQTGRVALWFLEKHGLGGYVSEVLGRDRFGSKRAELAWIRKRYGGPAVFIDDMPANCAVARELGFDAYLLRRELGDTLYGLLRKALSRYGSTP